MNETLFGFCLDGGSINWSTLLVTVNEKGSSNGEGLTGSADANTVPKLLEKVTTV